MSPASITNLTCTSYEIVPNPEEVLLNCEARRADELETTNVLAQTNVGLTLGCSQTAEYCWKFFLLPVCIFFGIRCNDCDNSCCWLPDPSPPSHRPRDFRRSDEVLFSVVPRQLFQQRRPAVHERRILHNHFCDEWLLHSIYRGIGWGRKIHLVNARSTYYFVCLPSSVGLI